VRRWRPCNMRPVHDPPIKLMSTLSIRLALQQMCVQFLQSSYNPIMKLTKVLWVWVSVLCVWKVTKSTGQLNEREGNGTWWYLLSLGYEVFIELSILGHIYIFCRFFMEFSRHYQFHVDIIGETLTLSTLHYVLSLLGCHYENMKMQKRELTAKHSSQWYSSVLCLSVCMIVLIPLQVTLCHSGVQGTTGVCLVHGGV